ncbi:MAG: hypothetical protein JW744_02600 [Candidatus Diapherotrites archaeon]|uniref:Signal-peptide peptidase, presenilin aspartyl protease n=1 Tax=Candidatus Iainarchaeum sp. TaxID=3101447 RepID=A0A938YSM2_9ARCH|nr:hypothetical protein [Candidatus Diapherotrites archaeon]
MDRLFPQLMAVFAITQLIGLCVGVSLIGAIETGELEQPTVVTENPDDPINAIALIVYILFFTGMLLILMRLFKGRWLFKLLETVVVFTASIIVFSAFIPSIAFLFTVLIVGLRLLMPGHIMLRNCVAIIAISGVGAMVGVTLGVIPIVLFLILLACYDFIAVFKTKHMVTLAKGIANRNLAFTVAMPTPKHQFELGTGDLVLPLAFAVSVMESKQAIGFPGFVFPAVLVLAASLAGLLITIWYANRHVGKALPALPLQAAFMVMAWALSVAVLP